MPGYVDISVSNLPSLGLYRFDWLHWLLLVLGQVFNTREKNPRWGSQKVHYILLTFLG